MAPTGADIKRYLAVREPSSALRQVDQDYACHCADAHRDDIRAFAVEAMGVLSFMVGIVGTILRGSARH